MIRAVFIDYTGTLMQEESRYAMQLATMMLENSSMESIQEVLRIWWGLIKKYEAQSYAERYITEDEILFRAIHELETEYDFHCDKEEFQALTHRFWSKSPAFDDVRPFFEKCTLPIYLITNNGLEYVRVFLEDQGLQCAGIVCGDMVKAYKPHRELFEKALEISGCTPDEVLHIGDSITSDVNGALAVGIRACLLDRKGAKKGEKPESYQICSSLYEVLDLARVKFL